MRPTRREMNMQSAQNQYVPEKLVRTDDEGTALGRGPAIGQSLLSMLQSLNARIYNTEKSVESAYSALYGEGLDEAHEEPTVTGGSVNDMREMIYRCIIRLDNIDNFISRVTKDMSHD